MFRRLPNQNHLILLLTASALVLYFYLSSPDPKPKFQGREVQSSRLEELNAGSKQTPDQVSATLKPSLTQRPEVGGVDLSLEAGFHDIGLTQSYNLVSSSPRRSLVNQTLKADADSVDKEDEGCVLLDKALQSSPPLVPINEAVFKSRLELEQNGHNCSENKIRSLIPAVIGEGYGLVAAETELGEKVWIENGVLYRPFRPSNITERYPSPYKNEFEAHVPFNSSMFFESGSNVTLDDKKIILWWTKSRYIPPMRGLEPMRSCPDFPCLMTTNRRYSSDSAAMVFSAQITRGRPPKRRPDQVFIFNNHEPPTSWSREPELVDIFRSELGWNDVFNWTMTYRLDSDVTSFYGLLRLRRLPVHKDYNAILARKTKHVAWIVSGCKTDGKRENYIRELSRYIQVDVIGNCGKIECPRDNDLECLKMVGTRYKFYLAFENAICTDYITEKFFRYLSTDVVVVARASNDFYAHAPSDVFVNAADFDSPKKLAKRLLHLAHNDEEYVKILRKKDKYMSILEDYPIRMKDGKVGYMHYHYEAVPFCEVCRRLWNLDNYSKTVPDIKKWFEEKLCRAPSDIKL